MKQNMWMRAKLRAHENQWRQRLASVIRKKCDSNVNIVNHGFLLIWLNTFAGILGHVCCGGYRVTATLIFQCFDRLFLRWTLLRDPRGTAKRQAAGLLKSGSAKPSIHGFTRLLHPKYGTEKQ
jgi:hypothetical protein